jgi:hypothetical protein
MGSGMRLPSPSCIPLAGDVYKVRHRRSTTEVMGNLGYDRIWMVDTRVGVRSYRELALPDEEFLMLLYERALIRTTGTAEYVVSTCAQGEVFIAVDIIPSSDDNTLSLVVASEDHSGGGTGSLRLFRI